MEEHEKLKGKEYLELTLQAFLLRIRFRWHCRDSQYARAGRCEVLQNSSTANCEAGHPRPRKRSITWKARRISASTDTDRHPPCVWLRRLTLRRETAGSWHSDAQASRVERIWTGRDSKRYGQKSWIPRWRFAAQLAESYLRGTMKNNSQNIRELRHGHGARDHRDRESNIYAAPGRKSAIPTRKP